MAKDRGGAVLHDVRTLFRVGSVAGLTDGQLLERFLARRGESAELAFAATIPGVFEVELHDAGTVLLSLQVG